MRHHHFGQGRYVLRLDPGEEVVASLRAFAHEVGIEAGVVTGLGSVDTVVLGFLDREGSEYVRRRFEERMEVGSLTGSLSMEGERPFVHLHAVVAPQEMLAYTGHVHEARVAAVLELYVTALPGRLDRADVAGQPFPALRLPGEEAPSGGAAAGR
jgi:predicted DNA-binding protein with PD1-like motif